MANLKIPSAALFAAAVLAAPAIARQGHVTSRHFTEDAYAATAPYAVYAAGPGAYVGGYRCAPAPRVGAFATQPWDNNVPCAPAFAPVPAY